MTTSSQHQGAPRSTDSPGRVLLIDDSESMLSAIASGLTAAGFVVIATSQIVGAARHLAACDLVILDFHMPGLDGAQVLASLKGAAQRTNARCMFLLYTSDVAQSRRYKEHGFDGPLTDKGDVGALVRQLRAYLRVARGRAASARK